MNIKILFFGDIIGRIGRQAIAKILPELKKEYHPDLVIANAENLAHGLGVTEKTLNECLASGIDFFTSGNHIWDKGKNAEVLQYGKFPIIRPANYPPNVEGEGYKIAEAGKKKVLIINLIGRVFFRENFDCPFRLLDEILDKFKNKKLSAIIVDFHAEATSEKAAFGWHADGRISTLFGTHTHIKTADARILPKGTAYITDVGMVGAKNSVIGDTKENVLEGFLTQKPFRLDVPENGTCIVDGVFVEINPKTRMAVKIETINREVEI